MNPTIKKIEFEKIGGPLFSGRDRGDRNREKYNLNSLDEEDVAIDVIIPENTYSITSSFFLGMFGKSIQTCGSKSTFMQKYRFQMPNRLNQNIDRYIARALRENTPLV